MKNYVQEGNAIYVTSGSDVVSGQFVLVENMHGVAAVDAKAGTVFALWTRGVYNLPKTQTETWHQGDYIYWDVSAAKCTNAAQTSGDPLIGVAVAAPPYTSMPQNPSDYGNVRLNPSF